MGHIQWEDADEGVNVELFKIIGDDGLIYRSDQGEDVADI